MRKLKAAYAAKLHGRLAAYSSHWISAHAIVLQVTTLAF